MLNVARVRQPTAHADIAGHPTATTDADRERGLWRFLTWSFFLSQLAAGNAFAGGGAQAGQVVDLNTPEGSSHSKLNSHTPGAQTDPRAIGLEEPPASAPESTGATAHPRQNIANAKSSDAEFIEIVSDSASAQTGAKLSLLADGGAHASQGGQLPSDDIAVDTPALVVDLDLAGAIDVLAPALDTVGNLAENIGGVLDDVLVPVVATVEDVAELLGSTLDQTVAPIENLVDGIVGGVSPSLEALISPVQGISASVGELIEPVGTVASEIMTLADPVVDTAETLLAPVMDIADAAQPIVQPVLNLADPVVDLIAPVAGPVVQPLASISEPVLDLLPHSLGHEGLLGNLLGGGEAASAAGLSASGSLEFQEEASAAGHELFEAGAYTEFGVALQDAIVPPVSNSIDVSTNVAATVDILLSDDPSDESVLPSLIANLQHEVALRGLGEGLM